MSWTPNTSEFESSKYCTNVSPSVCALQASSRAHLLLQRQRSRVRVPGSRLKFLFKTFAPVAEYRADSYCTP